MGKECADDWSCKSDQFVLLNGTGKDYMKTFSRIIVVAAVVAAIYFATIGRDQFDDVMEFITDLLQVIADNYLKK